MKDISYRVALGGIVSALCLVTMFLAGILPALYLVLPMIAGVLMMLIAVEVSKGWALLTYISVSILSLFITFDKEAALVFIMLFGHYPILRLYINKLPKLFRTVLRFAVFNVCAILFFIVTVYFFGFDQMLDELDDFGKYGGLVMLGICNVIFLLYDINLDNIYKIYRIKIMPRFKRKR